MEHTRTAADGAFTGTDASGLVAVAVDPDVVRPRVTLTPGWRSTVPPEALGPAVLEALRAALTARLLEGATRPPLPPTSAPPRDAGALSVELVLRAQADLAEFQTRLASLSSAVRSVSSTDRQVTVSVCRGELVEVRVERRWLDRAGDDAAAASVGDGLRAALALVATTPQDALDGCPYLLELLSRAPTALPFTLPSAPPARWGGAPRAPIPTAADW